MSERVRLRQRLRLRLSLRLMNYLQKWWQTMKVAWAKILVYRFNFFLQIIGPTLVFFFIKYSLWTKIYQSNGAQWSMVIQGYNLNQMLSYHLWILIISMVGQGQASFNLAEDIRLGRISTYLIYPFNFWEFHTAQFFSYQILQLFLSLCTLALIFLSQKIFHHQIININIFTNFNNYNENYCLLLGYIFSLMVSFFWFIVQFFIGLISFWLEETWTLRVIFQVTTQFLSGAIIPLDFFPTWIKDSLKYLPFPSLNYLPVRIFMGDPSPFMSGILILLFWTLMMIYFCHLIWKKGMTLYTASGI